MLFGKKKRRIHCILVVEDEALIAFDTEHLLSDAGYDRRDGGSRVADAKAVIDRGENVDLVLLDVDLADGSGVEVARAAQAVGVAVLFVTGHCPAEAMQLAQGWLAKPYASRDLVAAIAAIDDAMGGKTTRRLPQGFQLFAPAA